MKVSRDTWLSESDNQHRDNLLYDMFEGLYDQPQKCSRVFVKRKHVLIGGAFLVGVLVGVEVIPWSAILKWLV